MGIPYIYSHSIADDQVNTVQYEEDLSYMARKLEAEFNRNGLEININKTEDSLEYLTTAQETIRNLVTENGQEIKGTDKFKYLGFIIPKKLPKKNQEYNRADQKLYLDT